MHKVGASTYHWRRFWWHQKDDLVNVYYHLNTFSSYFLPRQIWLSLFITYFCTFFHLILLIFLHLLKLSSNFLALCRFHSCPASWVIVELTWRNQQIEYSRTGCDWIPTRIRIRRHGKEGRACWQKSELCLWHVPCFYTSLHSPLLGMVRPLSLVSCTMLNKQHNLFHSIQLISKFKAGCPLMNFHATRMTFPTNNIYNVRNRNFIHCIVCR